MVIVDTGFWVALANDRDDHHDLAKAKLSELREPLITTWPVVTETCYLLLARLGAASEAAFLDSLREGAARLFDLGPEHLARCSNLVRKYRDLPMDFADASLVVLAETLGSGRILSTDRRDFAAYRWKQHEPFENLMFVD